MPSLPRACFSGAGALREMLPKSKVVLERRGAAQRRLRRRESAATDACVFPAAAEPSSAARGSAAGVKLA